MVTKKSSAKKSTAKKTSTKSDASPKEIIEKYDCLKTHVKILTVLSGLIFLAVIMLGVILINSDDCSKNPAPAKPANSAKVVEEPEEEE